MSTLIQMSKKKILIIVPCFVVAIVIILLMLYKMFTKPAPVQRSPISKPKIESNYGKESLNIESILKKNDVDIPSSLSVFSLDQSVLSLEESKGIASRLGFSENPQSLNDARFGPVYIWSDGRLGNLRIVASLRIIDYKGATPDQTIKEPFKDEAEITSKAKRFLVGTGLMTENAISSPSVRYLNLTEEGLAEAEKANAGVAEVRLKETIGQYPIVNATPDTGTINVMLDKENSVISAYVDQINILNAQEMRQLITFSTLQANIKEAKILSLGDGSVDLPSLDKSEINKIIIDEASIGYFQEFSQNQLLLQPIFILKGIALFRNGGDVSALLYLPALTDLIQP